MTYKLFLEGDLLELQAVQLSRGTAQQGRTRKQERALHGSSGERIMLDSRLFDGDKAARRAALMRCDAGERAELMEVDGEVGGWRFPGNQRKKKRWAMTLLT